MKCSYKLSTFALFFLLVGFYSADSNAQLCDVCPESVTFPEILRVWAAGPDGREYARACAQKFAGQAIGVRLASAGLYSVCSETQIVDVSGGVRLMCKGCEFENPSNCHGAYNLNMLPVNNNCTGPACDQGNFSLEGDCSQTAPYNVCLEPNDCEYQQYASGSSCGHGGDTWYSLYEPTGSYCVEGEDECENADGSLDLECVCDRDPTTPGCQPFCEQYPDSPLCDDPDFCDENPNHPLCIDDDDDKGFCDRNPDHPGCAAFCDRNPWHPACVEVGDFCEQNPYHVRCNDEPDEEDFCEKYPFHPVCIDPGEFCDDYPYHPSCQDDRPFCERYPDSPACSNNLCEEFPEHPYCDDEEYCDKFPGDPLCLDCGNPDNEDPRCHVPYCDLYPDTPECRDTGDFCQQPGNQHSMWCIGCDDPAQSQQPWCQNQIPCYGDGCNEETGGFAIGSSCDKGQPICELESDPVGCALLWQVWYSSCGPESQGVPYGLPAEAVAGLPTDAEVEGEIGQMIDQFLLDSDLGEVDLSDAIVGDSFLPQTCPSPINLSLMGASVDVPLDPFCELATTVRPLVIAMFAIFSALIVIRGIW